MVSIGAFSCAFGSIERGFESIESLESVLEQHNIPLGLRAMGCSTFNQLGEPLEQLLADSMGKSLARARISAGEIDHIFFATSDGHLDRIDDDWAPAILSQLGMNQALPMLVSLQKCASSLAAVELARLRLEADGGGHAMVVAFDVIGDAESERIKPFALFGDGAASCIVSAAAPLEFALRACRTATDFDGLRGQDSFDSRRRAAQAACGGALSAAGIGPDEIAGCFSTNLFKPIALLNASLCGIGPTRLLTPTASRRAHCGNADWMVNLAAHQSAGQVAPGAHYLAQAYAPGFSACAVVTALPPLGPPQ